MNSSRSKFNWSILDRNTLINYFWSIHPEITDQNIEIKKFHAKLYNHIKKQLPIKVIKSRELKVAENRIWVGGFYHSERDRIKLQCIEIVLIYNLFQDEINIPKHVFYNVCRSLADTILHEIMHMRQYRRRKFKDIPEYSSTASRKEKKQEQQYLGNSDEIDAYSFNIACELLDKFRNNTESVINYLNENQKGKRRKHNCWRMYLKAFDHNHNHPIIHRVKKKVIRYLPHALNGKPYKNKDWINR